MISLKSLLSEMPAAGNLVTYHRSMENFKPGQVIGNHTKPHYLSDWFEIAMEEYRKDNPNYKNKPSRLTGVFSSFIPRSRFVDRGHLYMVRPQGKILITNSQYIDDARRKFDTEFYGSYTYDQTYKGKKPSDLSADQLKRLGWDVQGYSYWEGANLSRKNLPDMEILSETALVLNQLSEDSRRLKVKEDVEVTENDKIPVKLSLYFVYDTNQDDKNKDTHYHTAEEMDKVANDIVKHLFSSVKSSKGEDSGWSQFQDVEAKNKLRFHYTVGFLRKGVKLKIGYVQSTLMYNRQDTGNRGKYGTVSFGFFYNGKWWERKDHSTINPSFSFEYYPYDTDMNIRDIGKYLKRV